MLYGKVLRSPLPHALIKSIVATEAMRLSGVKAVLTCKNVPEWIGGACPAVTGENQYHPSWEQRSVMLSVPPIQQWPSLPLVQRLP
ncbi:MAG: hypothetical protein AB1523_05310 [Bacillota bacterium]